MEKYVNLSELCTTEITDGTHKTPTYSETGYKFLSSKNVTKGKIDWNNIMYIPEDLHNELYKRIAPQVDDILLAKNGTTGVAALVDRDEVFDIYVSLALIRPDKNKVNPRYLLYAINSLPTKRFFDSHLKGVGVPNLHLTHIRETPIKIVDMDNQEKIVEKLDCLSRLIENNEKQLLKLDELIKSRFIEMFGDRFTNNKQWNTKLLGECISFHNGKAHEQVVDENGEYILVTSKAIATDFEDVRRTNSLLYPLQKNDIVMVMSDVPNGRALAKCQLIDENDKYTLNQRICSFDNYNFNPLFLLHLLNRHKYFLDFNDGNGQTNLRKDDILKCVLIIPPIELQNQFSAFVEQTDKSKFEIQKSLEKLEILKKSLMQQYFG